MAPLSCLAHVVPLLGNWLNVPPLPRRLTAKIWTNLWWEGVYQGAVAASLAWVALIAFALIVAVSIWKSR